MKTEFRKVLDLIPYENKTNESEFNFDFDFDFDREEPKEEVVEVPVPEPDEGELASQYGDIKRWEDFTGEKAVLLNSEDLLWLILFLFYEGEKKEETGDVECHENKMQT